MKVNFKTFSLFILSTLSIAKADSCLKATRTGNWDGKEVVELNIKRENLCKSTAYELCKPLEIELLEIANVPKKNYPFDFGTTGLESDATLYRETISNLVEGNVQVNINKLYIYKYIFFFYLLLLLFYAYQGNMM